FLELEVLDLSQQISIARLCFTGVGDVDRLMAMRAIEGLAGLQPGHVGDLLAMRTPKISHGPCSHFGECLGSLTWYARERTITMTALYFVAVLYSSVETLA